MQRDCRAICAARGLACASSRIVGWHDTESCFVQVFDPPPPSPGRPSPTPGPKCVGEALCSAAIFLLEVQRKWWLPAPLKLGWQVGLWNFIGAWGFEASGSYHSSAPAIDKEIILPAIRVSTWCPTEMRTHGLWHQLEHFASHCADSKLCSIHCAIRSCCVSVAHLVQTVHMQASAVFGYLAFPREIAQRWGTYFSTFWVRKCVRTGVQSSLSSEAWTSLLILLPHVLLMQGGWAFLIGMPCLVRVTNWRRAPFFYFSNQFGLC